MKFPRTFTLPTGAAAAVWLALVLPLAGQPAADDPAPPEPPAAQGAREPGDLSESVEGTDSTASPTQPEEASELRRLDVPSTDEPARTGVGEADEMDATTEPAPQAPRRQHRHQRQTVQFFTDIILHADESSEELVAIFGNVVADGVAHGSAVAVMGNTTVNGAAHEAVAVMGSVSVSGRTNGPAVAIMGDTTVDGEAEMAVAVLGSVSVNGRVRGELVAVMGDVRLGPNAIVEGEVISVGGRVERAPGAQVYGGTQQIGPFPMVVEGAEGLRTWFRVCFLLGRPLAFDARVAWAWGVAAVFLAFYLFIALLFNRSVTACAQTLERHPGMTIVTALVTALLAPLLTILLSFIAVGLLLIPLLMLASLYGKAAFLAWLGRRITLPIGWSHAFPAVLIGGIILMLLYAVPFLGFVLMKGTSILGLGMVVHTVLLAGRRERPSQPVPPPGPAPVASPAAPVGASAAASSPLGAAAVADAPSTATGPSVESTSGVPAAPQWTPPPVPAPSDVPAPTPVSPAAVSAPTFAPTPTVAPQVPLADASLPRAGFWLRLGASLLDALLVGIVLGMVGLSDYLPILFATYCVVLWALRATTIGGIICGLKVVRLDERKIDWSIAIVRALGGFLSLAIVGLGFIWVAFDKESQSWHDKIAGTTIVRVPKGVTLV